VEQGIRGTESYFGWFEDPAERPVNRLEPVGVPGRVPEAGPLGVPVEAN
jgi:hypothetical protein